MTAYQPELVRLDEHHDLLRDHYDQVEPSLFRRRPGAEPLVVPHPDLAILLTTSGSTGSPKFVRLSTRNVTSNATAIATALRIDRQERAVTSMPLHYSYGMSILNSHLIAGASVIITDASVLEPRFWEDLRQHEATSLAGVPYTYQMLERIGFDPADQPTLRSMTQAGGKMPEPLTRRFADRLAAHGIGLYVMYGQTEAAPRIAVLPAERLDDKVGSAGVALPGGALTIDGPDGPTDAPDVSGEVVYTGANVMMGYADGRADLSVGDVHGDTLRTGDLGHLDADGYLFITGRSSASPSSTACGSASTTSNGWSPTWARSRSPGARTSSTSTTSPSTPTWCYAAQAARPGAGRPGPVARLPRARGTAHLGHGQDRLPCPRGAPRGPAMTTDDLFARPQFGRVQAEKEALLLAELRALTEHHRRGCADLRTAPRHHPARRDGHACRRAVPAGQPLQEPPAGERSRGRGLQDAHVERHDRPAGEPLRPRPGHGGPSDEGAGHDHDARARAHPAADDRHRHAERRAGP